MTAAALDVRDLHVFYGAVHAVRGVSLLLRPAEAVAIIGSNGAGKTSLLRGIMGLVPARADITLDGEKLGGRPTYRIARMGIAYVPEGRELFRGLTVAEEPLVGGRLVPAPDFQRRIDEALTLFPRLAERRNQVTRTMSGGEQQMVAVARALMTGPRLLLLDEPSLGLAPVIQDAMYAALRALRDKGLTMLLVEQNAHRALDLCARAHVLAVGRFAQEGPSDALRHDPALGAAYLGA